MLLKNDMIHTVDLSGNNIDDNGAEFICSTLMVSITYFLCYFLFRYNFNCKLKDENLHTDISTVFSLLFFIVFAVRFYSCYCNLHDV